MVKQRWWVSFAGPVEPIGVVVADAETAEAAIKLIRDAGLYPAGDVQAVAVSVPETYDERAVAATMALDPLRLYSKAELEARMPTLALSQLTEEQRAIVDAAAIVNPDQPCECPSCLLSRMLEAELGTRERDAADAPTGPPARMLVAARLARREVEPGWDAIFENIPLGTEYLIDLASIQQMELSNSKTGRKKLFPAGWTPSRGGGWMLLPVLDRIDGKPWRAES